MNPVRTAVSNWLYDKGPGRYYRPAYGHIARAIGLSEGAFLDVGCGPGWLSIQVAAGRPDLDAVGIDRSPGMIALADRHRGGHLNITFREMEASHILYAEGTFSAAAAVQSAHHWQDTPAILAEVHRVLQPAGCFYVYEADRDQTEVPQDWIERRRGWPPDRVVRLGWQRFGMDAEEWGALRAEAEASPFSTVVDDRHGFYRRLVLTR